MNLKDKLCVVTGASAGIGLITAERLSDSGARVIAVARRLDRLEALKKKYPTIEIVQQDIQKPLKALESAIGNRRVDILVNNAGLALGRETIGKIQDSDYVTMIDTNIRALIAVTQLVLPKMIEAGGGDIVNLGSVAGYQTYATGSVYCATKFAVRALTDAFRQDLLGKGIRVIGIHPGMVETEFSIVRLKGDEAAAKKLYENVNHLTPEDIAETVVWSLSRPRHVNIHSMIVMPTDQASVREIYRS